MRSISSAGGMSTSSTASAPFSTRSGTVSATRTPVTRATASAALKVLDVHRRPDLDARVAQLVDVLPALGVTATWARCYAPVRRAAWMPGRRPAPHPGRIPPAPGRDTGCAPRQARQRPDGRLRLGAAMRLDEADQHVAPILAAAALRQHLHGLADAGGGAEEYLSAAPASPLRASATSGIRVGACGLGRVHALVG